MKYEHELAVALDAVKKAALICRKVQADLVTVQAMEKEDKSPVTIADLGSQALVNHSLLQEFPGASIIAEEDSQLLRDNAAVRSQILQLVQEYHVSCTSDQIIQAIDGGRDNESAENRFWTVDPIDGTKGFLRGEQYAIALALVDHGEVVLGVLGCPNFPEESNIHAVGRGGLFYAVKNEGAYRIDFVTEDNQRVSVDRNQDPAAARFCESVEKAHASHEEHALISSAAGIAADPYRIDSQAKYAAVGCGFASVYLRLPRTKEYREKIWDHAAGALLVEEAGGKVTDFSGSVLDFSQGERLSKNEGILATNGFMHRPVLDAIKRVI